MWVIDFNSKYCMIYLYVKTHNKTGLKYLGQTNSRNPHTYPGSGLYWKAHLKKYGRDVSTEILKECNNKEEIKHWGEYYSNLWNVVADESWANLKPETGDGGSLKGTNLGRRHTKEELEKMSKTRKGKANPKNKIPRTEEQKQHLRELNLGKKQSKETIEKRNKTRKELDLNKWSEETRRKLTGIKRSEDTRLKCREAQQKRRSAHKEMWITNGVKNSLIKITDPIPLGWRNGRTIDSIPPSQKGRIWINNGVISKMSDTILEGWTKGRIYNRRKKNVIG